MLEVTQREAAQIMSGRQTVIRRALYKVTHKRGDVITIRLSNGQEVCKIRIDAIYEIMVSDMTDERAHEEAFANLSGWASSWMERYKGTNRTRGDTKVTTFKIRRMS